MVQLHTHTEDCGEAGRGVIEWVRCYAEGHRQQMTMLSAIIERSGSNILQPLIQLHSYHSEAVMKCIGSYIDDR